MSNTDQSGAGGLGNFASDATIDTGADGFINTAVDDIASHIPGGAGFEGTAKTGIDQEANTLINGEISNLEGMFGHKDG